MRKDVKIGLAIAGVLFAVLIVYLFVPSGDPQQTATGDGQPQQTDPVEGAIPEGAEPPTDPSVEPLPPVVQDGSPTGNPDAFAPNAPADPAGTSTADAGGSAGTDWLRSFETGKVVVESHPPLVAQTRTPSKTDAPAEVDHSVVGADPDQTPAAPEQPGAPLMAQGAGAVSIPPVVDSPSDGATGNGGSADGNSASPITPSGTPGATSTGNGSGRTHVMQRGETFSSVAKAVYGKSNMYLQIQKANPTLNPTSIRPGTVINLPDASAAAAPAPSADPTGTATANTGGRRNAPEPKVNASSEYRIAPGDSLYKISVKLYGAGTHVDDLYEMNKATIGDDPARLKVGTVLKLHEAPRVAASR